MHYTAHGIEFQEKSEHSTLVRSANRIVPSCQKSFKVKTYNLLVVKINSKSPPSKTHCDVVFQNEERQTFSLNIDSLEVRPKNTFWGKSNYSKIRRSGYG